MFELIRHVVIAVLLSLSQPETATVIHPAQLLTQAEQERARSFANQKLRENFLPLAMKDPKVFRTEGIALIDPHLGEPFLDISLRDRSLLDYVNSGDDDPRGFGSLCRYCFPVYVAAHPDPIITIVVGRNYDRDRDTVFTDEGEFYFFGYYFVPGITQNAIDVQKLQRGRVSFVEFIDTSIPRRVIIDGVNGILSGAETDSLVTLQDDARRIKAYLSSKYR